MTELVFMDILVVRLLIKEGRHAMPHINVKMFPGRDDEKKKDLADKLLQCAQEALGCPAEALSVSVEDVAPEDWNRDVGAKIPEDKIYSGEMYKVK